MSPSHEDESDPPRVPGQGKGKKIPAVPPALDPTLVPHDEPEATLVSGDGTESTIVHGDEADATLVSAGGADGTVVQDGGGTPVPAQRAGRGGGGKSPTVKGKVFANRFEVVDLLGEGGMGKVFQVRDRQIEGREVALKVLRPRFSRNEQFRSLFFQEIRAAQNFVSEHVVQVRDTGQMDDGLLFLTMDMVEGESLRSMLDREGSLGVRHALEIARQVLLGLQSGHEQGFVHRDIKPPNVMLAARTAKTEENPYGVSVRLLDFGIAGLAAEVGEGDVAGTPWYMSPEQTQGQRLDGRSDLFAVGVLFYEMVTGSRPFEGDTLQEVTTSVLEHDVSPQIADIADLSAPLQKLLRKALQKNRDKRFQSAADFVQAIEKSKAYRLPTDVPRWVIAAAFLIGIVAAAEGFFLWQQYNKLEETRNQVALAANEKTAALQDLRGEFDTEREELKRELREKSDRIIELENEQQDNATEAVETRSDTEDIKTLRQQILDLTQRADLADQERLAAEQRAQSLEDELEDLQSRNDELTVLDTDEARLATKFDDLVRYLNEEPILGKLAASTYQAMVDEGLLTRANVNGRAFLESLTTAARLLQEYEEKTSEGDQAPDAALLREALGHLDQTDGAMRAFIAEAQAAAWLSFTLEEDGEPTNREQQAKDAAVLVRQKVEAELLFTQTQHEDAARAIAEGPPDQPLGPVLVHARSFECEHLDELLARFAAHLRTTAVGAEGIDLGYLQGLAVLDEWASHLESLPASSRTPEAMEVLRLHAARRWYTDKEPTPWAPAADSLADAGSSTVPRKNWMVELALQQQFTESDTFPLQSGQRLVYRNENLASGLVVWFIDTLEEVPEDLQKGPWAIERKVYINDGTKRSSAQSYEYSRRGMVYLQAGRPVLDLQESGPKVMNVSWNKPAVDSLPAPSWFPRQDELDAFRSQLIAAPARCLVVQNGDDTRWFSPLYGVVKEEKAGVFRRELVFVGPVD